MDSYRTAAVFSTPFTGPVHRNGIHPAPRADRGLGAPSTWERTSGSRKSPLIRATEGTVRERIPPRMEIRRGAPLESPHVLLLIDDDERSLIEGLGDRARERAPRYETDLMLGAGSIRGWALDREEDWAYPSPPAWSAWAERAASRYATGEKESTDASVPAFALPLRRRRRQPLTGHRQGRLGRVQSRPRLRRGPHGASRPLGPGGGGEHLR
jgi:hypothetical protein